MIVGTKSPRILVINGPNTNLLGSRDPKVYGFRSLDSLEKTVREHAEKVGARVAFFQSNSEGMLINKIQVAPRKFDGIIYNPAAHTHYSYALRDAVEAVDIPVIEVHLSDISKRESFRRKSVIAPVCIAQIKGRGVQGYCEALDILMTCDYTEKLGDNFEQRYEPSQITIGGHPELHVGYSDAEEQVEEEEQVAFDNVATSDSVTNGAFGIPLAHDEEDPFNPDLAWRAAAFTHPNSFRDLSQHRINLVRDRMAKHNIDGAFVRDTTNIAWLCVSEGVFDQENAHSLFITPKRAILHTDSRYVTAVRSEIKMLGTTIEVDDRKLTHADFMAHVLEEYYPKDQTEFTIAIEDEISLQEFNEYRAAADRFDRELELSPTRGIVRSLRAVKDANEIAHLKIAQSVTDAAFAHLLTQIKAGMTEAEVKNILESYALSHGASEMSFSTIVASGPHSACAHATPGDSVLEEGECVVIDVGVKVMGYCSDMTRTLFVGPPSEEMKQVYETLRKANETVCGMLRPGVTGREAYERALHILEEEGFKDMMGHALGHGVGMDIHELPVLSPRNENELVPGNVVTVEPGIYIPNRFGMRLEDCGVITKDGFEVFANTTHSMIII